MKNLLSTVALAAIVLPLFTLAGNAIPLAPITAHQALANRGQCVSIEGTASVRPDPQRLGMNLDIDGKDSSAFGYILPENVSQFPGLSGLEGKRVNITGVVGFYRGRAQIVLISAKQLNPAGSGNPNGLTHIGPEFARGSQYAACGL